MTDLIGQTVGQYRIVEKIGKGGMANVYKAYQPGLDRYVAVKILPEYFLHDETFLARFEREAKAIARLSHSHILPVYDFGRQEKLTYIVMQYVEAGTLQDMLGEPLDLRLAAGIIDQIASALDYAHKRGIIHRDVKPSNVLMEEGERTLLSDFGLAKMVEASVQLTGSGVGVGTPAYMSPEQGQGKEIDARSDVYSLGIVLYEMATGRVPYTAETPMAVVLKHVIEPLPLPRNLNPALPEAVERVILKALAKDPADRFASAGEMTRALQNAVAGLPVEAEPMPPPAEVLPTLPEVPVTKPAAAPAPPVAEKPVPTEALKRKVELPLAGVVVGVVAVLLLLAVVAGVVLLSRRGAGAPGPTPGVASVPTAVDAVISPTLTYTLVPPTDTAIPPADTPSSPTDTPLPPTPTGTPEPTPTSTPLPPTPTDTPLPPTPTLSLAPYGGRIAFESYRDGNFEIYVMNADGSGQTNLTNNPASDMSPSWSPNGSRIAFTSNRDGNFEIYVMNADGSGVTRLTNNPAGDGSPSWSPDGSRIAFMIYRDDGSREIYVMNADGSGVTRLTNNSAWNHSPSWSPDGSCIAFTRTEDTNGDGTIDLKDTSEIYMMNADGSGQTNLTNNPAGDGSPSWSPDGSRIAFTSNRDGNFEIYVMNTDGSRVTRLTDKEGIVPSWSPDGMGIAFHSNRDGNFEIYVMNTDGSGQTNLTNSPDTDMSPSWGP